MVAVAFCALEAAFNSKKKIKGSSRCFIVFRLRRLTIDILLFVLTVHSISFIPFSGTPMIHIYRSIFQKEPDSDPGYSFKFFCFFTRKQAPMLLWATALKLSTFNW
jgi:hypothetical protein